MKEGTKVYGKYLEVFFQLDLSSDRIIQFYKTRKNKKPANKKPGELINVFSHRKS